MCRPRAAPPTGTFPLATNSVVLSADRTRVLEPGDPDLGWLAKTGPARPRLPRRRGQDQRDVPRRRRRPLRGARRPGPARGPTGPSSSTGGTPPPSTPAARRSSPRRSRRRSRSIRTCTTAWWPAGRASAGATRWWPSCSCAPATPPDAAGAAAWRRRPAWRATSCRRRSCSWTRWCARRRARPTTAGRARSPPRVRRIRPLSLGLAAMARGRRPPLTPLCGDVPSEHRLSSGASVREAPQSTADWPDADPAARRPAPRGRGQGRRRAGDVRHHRPPLRPREPGHDVPDGRRVAPRHGRHASAWPRAPPVVDLASGTGDLCVELAARGYRPRVGRPVLRHAGGRPQRRAPRPGRHPAPPARRPAPSTA